MLLPRHHNIHGLVRVFLWTTVVLLIFFLLHLTTSHHPSALFSIHQSKETATNPSSKIEGIVSTLTGHTSNKPTQTSHPVTLLHNRATSFFTSLLTHQSTTLPAAIAAYHHRYSQPPPPGFSEWFAYAQSVQSPIIDDFDTLDDGIRPFFSWTPSQVRDVMAKAVQLDTNGNAKLLRFGGGEFVKKGDEEWNQGWVDGMMRQLGDAVSGVPNVTALFNFWDEPSVLPVIDEYEDDAEVIHYNKMSGRPLGPAVRQACELGSNARAKHTARKAMAWDGAGDAVDTIGIPFVTSIEDAKDICAHPEYANLHGLLISPPTLFHMPVLVPMLSQAAPLPFQDILMPAGPHGGGFPVDKIAWEEKESALFWAGKSTGSRALDEDENTWRQSHRQRAVLFGNHVDHSREYTYLKPISKGGYEPYTSRNFVKGMFDLSITGTVQCPDKTCKAQQEVFGPLQPSSDQEPFKYKFALDIDGNSYTGRYYRLLASNSAVLKMTILREWHDDRLVPWLHYIPVSQSLDEMAELMRFLTTTEEGQEVGRKIAEAGREWYHRALGPVHQGVYLYRLFLEMAWLQDDRRQVILRE